VNAPQSTAREIDQALPEQWRCFHCDEVFQDETEARLHFGRSERQSPACQIDIAEYRAMEQRMVSYNDEDSDMHRQIYRMQNDHAQALLRVEEKGYARGLADGAPYLAEREAAIEAERAEVVRLMGDLRASEEEQLKLRAVLAELLNSHAAEYPSFEAGKQAQDDWSSRRAKAVDAALAALATPTQGEAS
jgi:hypothetical protein